MSYLAGIGPNLAAALGQTQGPHFVCNGCGKEISAITKAGFPKAWFRRAHCPPGWTATFNGLVWRHKCAQCREEPGK